MAGLVVAEWGPFDLSDAGAVGRTSSVAGVAGLPSAQKPAADGIRANSVLPARSRQTRRGQRRSHRVARVLTQRGATAGCTARIGMIPSAEPKPAMWIR